MLVIFRTIFGVYSQMTLLPTLCGTLALPVSSSRLLGTAENTSHGFSTSNYKYPCILFVFLCVDICSFRLAARPDGGDGVHVRGFCDRYPNWSRRSISIFNSARRRAHHRSLLSCVSKLFIHLAWRMHRPPF